MMVRVKRFEDRGIWREPRLMRSGTGSGKGSFLMKPYGTNLLWTYRARILTGNEQSKILSCLHCAWFAQELSNERPRQLKVRTAPALSTGRPREDDSMPAAHIAPLFALFAWIPIG